MLALLLHLRKLFVETAVFGSASGLGCCLVVAIVQAIDFSLGMTANNFKLEDNRQVPPLIIFYQQAPLNRRLYEKSLIYAACWLRRFLQVPYIK